MDDEYVTNNTTHFLLDWEFEIGEVLNNCTENNYKLTEKLILN